jgi:hypothetical protein
MESAIFNLLDYSPYMSTDASVFLEMSHQVSDDGESEWFGLINHCGQMGNGFYEPLPLPGFNISFTPLKEVESIRLLGAGKTVPISNMEDGKLTVRIEGIDFYDVLLVEYSK